jgi:hypothetical protein
MTGFFQIKTFFTVRKTKKENSKIKIIKINFIQMNFDFDIVPNGSVK